MSKTIKIQIRVLETLVSLLGKVNAGIDRAQAAINGALDCLQSRATKVLNDRIERLADELLLEAVEAGHRPYIDADCDHELERLNHEYEVRKAEVERLRNEVLSQHNLTVAREISDAYLAERQAILNRKK